LLVSREDPRREAVRRLLLLCPGASLPRCLVAFGCDQLLLARRAVDGQQRAEVGQIDIPVKVEVAFLIARPAGLSIVGEQLRLVGQIDVAVIIEVA